MEYSVFAQELLEQLAAVSPENIEVQLIDVPKNNGVRHDAFIFYEDQVQLPPTIYVQQYYQEFCRGKDLSSLAKNILDHLERLKKETPYKDFLSNNNSFEQVRDRIIYRLVNFEKNKEALQSKPHIRFLDLAITFYCMVKKSSAGVASFSIKNELMELWQVDTSTLYLAALDNMPRLFPPRIRPISDVLKRLFEGMVWDDTSFIEASPDDPLSLKIDHDMALVPMYVMTCEGGINGSGTILYPNILKIFGEKIGKNLLILPSSVHEVLLIPDSPQSLSLTDLSNMVCEINRSQVLPEEILSDHAYRYITEKNAFEPVE